MIATPEDIIGCFQSRGHLAYAGEGVTQLQHGWQCARLARQAGASHALVLASWLHDLGHLLTDLPGSPTLNGVDDAHEVSGAFVLQNLFGEVVARPVALHVLAKRYLVAKRPAYVASLSEDSRRSLTLQGGALSSAACQVFLADSFSQDALRLRTWDDMAKRGDLGPADARTALCELRRLMAVVLALEA